MWRLFFICEFLFVWKVVLFLHFINEELNPKWKMANLFLRCLDSFRAAVC